MGDVLIGGVKIFIDWYINEYLYSYPGVNIIESDESGRSEYKRCAAVTFLIFKLAVFDMN